MSSHADISGELPDAAFDEKPAAAASLRKAVVAGGCFWGMEAVFESVKGVKSAVSGYSGGAVDDATYEKVSQGRSGHAEAVEITYDPREVTYGQLLKIFFAVAHDPTQLDRQGPDHGPQYRSAIFYADDGQKEIAARYIAQLKDARSFPRPIVTQLVPLEKFHAAEAYHQDYAKRNPAHPYIVMHDAPKLADLKKRFPQLCTAK